MTVPPFIPAMFQRTPSESLIRADHRIARALILAAAMLMPGTMLGQVPTPPGFTPRPCPTGIPIAEVHAEVDTYGTFSFVFYAVKKFPNQGMGSPFARYFAPPDTKSLNPDNQGRYAYWMFGEVNFHCFERRVVLPNRTITDYLYIADSQTLGGYFEIRADEGLMCDEYGNIVEQGGEPCEPSGPSGGDGGGEGRNTTNCFWDYIYVEVDDGSGWEVVWQGYAEVCEG